MLNEMKNQVCNVSETWGHHARNVYITYVMVLNLRLSELHVWDHLEDFQGNEDLTFQRFWNFGSSCSRWIITYVIEPKTFFCKGIMLMVAWKIAKGMDFVKIVLTKILLHHARD